MIESCYELGWTYGDYLEAPVKEILRCQRASARKDFKADRRSLILVNTIVGIVGGEPVDIPEVGTSKKKRQNSATKPSGFGEFIDRFEKQAQKGRSFAEDGAQAADKH